MRKVFIFLIKLYKISISPILPHSCRFYPSCSSYAIEAIEMHGAVKGLAMAAWRILRCNPFGGSGYDPARPGLNK